MTSPWQQPVAWCNERVEQLRKHHAAGLSFSVLAEMFRTSRSAIAGKCARLNLVRIEKDFAAAGRIGGKIAAQNRKRNRPPKFNFARKPSLPKQRVKAAVASDPRVLATGAPPSLSIPLENLEPHHCRFIPGDDRRFCGQPKVEGSSYCGFHTKVCRA